MVIPHNISAFCNSLVPSGLYAHLIWRKAAILGHIQVHDNMVVQFFVD